MCACMCVCVCVSVLVGVRIKPVPLEVQIHYCDPCMHTVRAKSCGTVDASREEPQERRAVDPDGDA